MDENEVFKVTLVPEVLYNCLFNDPCVYPPQNYNLPGLFHQADTESSGAMSFTFTGGYLMCFLVTGRDVRDFK